MRLVLVRLAPFGYVNECHKHNEVVPGRAMGPGTARDLGRERLVRAAFSGQASETITWVEGIV